MDERYVKRQEQRLIKLLVKADNEIKERILINITSIKNLKDREEIEKYLKAVQQKIQIQIRGLQRGSVKWVQDAIPACYMSGATEGFKELEKAGMKLSGKAGAGALHRDTVNILADQSYTRFRDMTTVIGRKVNDLFRTIGLKNIEGAAIGYETWKESATRIREDIKARGITAFYDKRGNEWSLRTYGEMVARTTTMEAVNAGKKNEFLRHGEDLVRISTHLNSCPMCAPYQNKILSLSGRSTSLSFVYCSMEEAKAAGLFHPNCRHSYTLYIPRGERAEEEESLRGRAD